MRIAVVIPLFNHDRFIAAALRSVLAQTAPVDRIIVIDDGSSDTSVQAARGVLDKRIEIIEQQNAGAHAAINRGIGMAANADFIGILNSDDLYEQERFERCLAALEGNPRAAVAATRLRIIDDNGTPLPAGEPRRSWLEAVWRAGCGLSLPAWLGVANFTKTTSNLFGRADWFREHPFRPYRYVHDYYFALEAALEDRLLMVDEELLRYRVHDSNTIKSGPADNLPREVLRMNLDLLGAMAGRLAASSDVRARYAEYFRELGRNQGDFRLEPFLRLLAERFAGYDEPQIEALCESMGSDHYPELGAAKSRALRERLAVEDYEKALQELASSRFMSLGRVLGLAPRVRSDAPTAEKRLSALRKAMEGSAWYKLGRTLGLVYAEDVLAEK